MDKNVQRVMEKLEQRAQIGIKKYGVTTERTDLDLLDWLRHAQEEAMDFCVYLEVAIQMEMTRRSILAGGKDER